MLPAPLQLELRVTGFVSLTNFFITDTLSVWLILQFWNMFFTSSLKFLNSPYLSLEFQSNVGSLIPDSLILSSMFSTLAVPAVAMVCITTLAALATACATYSLEIICSFAFFVSLFDCYLAFAFKSAFLRLPCSNILICWDCLFWVWLIFHVWVCLCYFLILTSCSVSCLIGDDTGLWLFMYLLLYVNICHIQCVHMLICTEVVHSSGYNTWCLLVM